MLFTHLATATILCRGRTQSLSRLLFLTRLLHLFIAFLALLGPFRILLLLLLQMQESAIRKTVSTSNTSQSLMTTHLLPSPHGAETIKESYIFKEIRVEP